MVVEGLKTLPFNDFCGEDHLYFSFFPHISPALCVIYALPFSLSAVGKYQRYRGCMPLGITEQRKSRNSEQLQRSWLVNIHVATRVYTIRDPTNVVIFTTTHYTCYSCPSIWRTHTGHFTSFIFIYNIQSRFRVQKYSSLVWRIKADDSRDKFPGRQMLDLSPCTIRLQFYLFLSIQEI